MRVTLPRGSLPALAVVAALCVGGAACQLIGGIGDIELAALDGGGEDGRAKTDAHHLRDARGDAHDGHTTKKDARPPPPDAGRDVEPGGTPCGYQGACYPSGTLLGNNDYCADGSVATCGQFSACCPGNDNPVGTNGDFCENNQTICSSGGQCVQCGGLNQPCCLQSSRSGPAGGQACRSGACIGGLCTQCGGAAQPCCNTQGLCQGGGACTAVGACVTCSCNGYDCCDSNGSCVAPSATCSNGTVCPGNGGPCDRSSPTPPCGVSGSPCCNSKSPCHDGSLCVASMCTACGSAGEPCCVDAQGKKSCVAGMACDNQGDTCVACGGVAQPCCTGGVCTTGTCNPLDNVCDVALGCGAGCGGKGQPCCGGDTCAPGSCCDVSSELGSLCRLPGEACSGGGAVCAGAACTSCGASGSICCANGTCEAGACMPEAGLCP